MEKEKLTEELTEKISGGVKVESKSERPHGSFKSGDIEVKCAKCGGKFNYFREKNPYTLNMELDGPHGYWEMQRKRRICPHCGYGNSEKELGI